MPRACPVEVTARPQPNKTLVVEPGTIPSIAAWEAVKRACGVSDSRAARGARGRPTHSPRQVEGAGCPGSAALETELVRVAGAPERRALGPRASIYLNEFRQRLH